MPAEDLHEQLHLEDDPTNNSPDTYGQSANVERIDKTFNVKDFYIFNEIESINRKGQKFNLMKVSGSHYSIALQDYLIGISSLGVAPSIGLPKPSIAGLGKTYLIEDQVGGAGTTSILIKSEGEALINGQSSVTINKNYGRQECHSDGNAWFCSAPSNSGSIAFEAGTDLGTQNSGNDINQSFNNVSANLMFVGAFAKNGIISTGATYNGVAMTLVAQVSAPNQGTAGCILYLYMLKGPAVGTHSLVISFNSSLSAGLGVVSTYTHTSPTSQPDNSATVAQATTSAFPGSVSAIADQCWGIMIASGTGNGINGGTPPTAGTNTVIRAQSSNNLSIADTGVAQSPGTVTMNFNSTSQVYAGIIATFSSA